MSPSDSSALRPVIWMRNPVPRRGPKPAHTREEISRAAVSIADEHGLEQVSIRAVAKDLGAGAASLYRYIDTKADLYDLMVDTVIAEFALPTRPTGRWKEDLVTIAERSRVVHRHHPWAYPLFSGASWGPHTQAYMEFFLAALAPTGLSLREQTEFIAHFTSSVATFAAYEHEQSERPGDSEALAARLMHLNQIAEDPDLPHLSAAVRSMLTAEPTDTDELFRGTVARLLDSIPSRGKLD